MRDERVHFYKTKAWKDCRRNYFKAHPLCEKCLALGMVTPGEIVHHKEHISLDNLTDQSVLTNWENLQTLCRLHHAEAHPEIYKSHKRYRVDELGRVHIKAPHA